MSRSLASAAPVDVHALGDQLLEQAAGAPSQRAAMTLPHPVDGLRQTVIALCDGAELQEHESPGPASLLVLRGHARLVAGEEALELGPNTCAPIRRRGTASTRPETPSCCSAWRAPSDRSGAGLSHTPPVGTSKTERDSVIGRRGQQGAAVSSACPSPQRRQRCQRTG